MIKLLVGLIAFVAVINYFAWDSTRAEMDSRPSCQVLIKNNSPEIAIVNGNLYYLNKPTERMFINQFDAEQLNNLSQCQKVEM